MGASNELPESEELEALYDRFLLRRMVAPVSDVSILDMIQQTQEQGAAVATTDGEAQVSITIVYGINYYTILLCIIIHTYGI